LAAAKYTSPAVRVTGNGPRPVDRTIRVNLELPLFDFSAPNVRGASVDVTIFTRTALSVGWQVALGAGGGHTGTFTLKEMAQFTANPGEAVRIFVPIPAIATRRYYVSLGVSGRYEFQPLSETGFDAISPIKEAGSGIPAHRELSPSEAFDDQTVKLREYSLNHASPRTPAVYAIERETNWQYSVRAGGTALGIEVGVLTSVSLADSLAIKMTLPGGHAYRLDNRPGIRWITDPLITDW
jgi:hypothetical protein